MSKLLKQKYHLTIDFVDDKLDHHSSFMWRSLLSRCKLHKNGLLWRIGNGKKTKIWKDKWIHRPMSHSIQSPIHLLDEDALITELIDQDAHYQKQDLINQIFSPKEVRAITSIPLSIIDRDDLLVLYPAKNGLFSVKCAYHFHHSISITNKGTPSINRIPPIVLKSFLKLVVPNRAIIFIWRACKEILPTFQNLKKKRITKFDLCPICLHHTKTIFHAIWDCEASRDISCQSCHKVQKTSFLNISFLDLWTTLSGFLTQQELNEVATLAYLIQNRRNDFVNNKNLSTRIFLLKKPKMN